MPDAPPGVLVRLLAANEAAARDASWAEFVATYSRLLLHVTRSVGGEHDPAMDRYAFVLEQLGRDDFRRLRTYVADGRSEFTTWLVVVAQRLCRDHRRQRYGRVRPQGSAASVPDEERLMRRRLVDLIGAEIDLGMLADQRGDDAEATIRQGESRSALESALARLDRRDRLLIKLRFEDDLPMPEVASNLGFPTRFHAYRRLKEVLGMLRRSLESRGVGEAAP
jgi:RNA polymerase sigma factor (sigma-70 family)